MKTIEKRKMLRVRTDGSTSEMVNDEVAVESQISIVINGNNYVTLACTPDKLEDLVMGHLLSEGIIDDPSQITHVQVAEGYRCEVDVVPELDLAKRIERADSQHQMIIKGYKKILSSSVKSESKPVLPVPSSGTTFPISALQKAANSLSRDTVIYRRTGGVHAACIARADGRTVCLAEDIARYNAVDKVIGRSAIQGYSLHDKFLAVTGRVARSIVLKAVRVKIPVIVSISAVMASGVDTAEMTGVTVVGFCREGRMNIYTYPDRIVLSG
jgi:FdhD protein